MSVSLSRVECLQVGDVGAGERLLGRLRLMGERGLSVTVTVSGAHADRLSLVAGRTVCEGAGPHELAARGRRVNVGLIFEAPLEAGAIDCSLTFDWGDGSETVSYEGDVVVFDVDRAEVDFQASEVGETRQRVVTIHNRSHVAIDVELRALASPFTSAPTGSVTIDARAPLHVVLEMTPTATGPADATLEIARGAQVEAVSLTGVGTPEPTESEEAAESFEEAADASQVGDSASTPTEQFTAAHPSGGGYQRLYLHVPTKNTNVTLGKEYDGTQHDPTHAGYSATTEGHVLIRNRVANSTMTLQSKGQAWFQSTTKDVFLGAGDGGFNFISGSGTYLSSGKGIVIAAGHGDMGEMNEFDSGAEPPVPAIASIGDSLAGVQQGWKIAGFLMSGFGLAYTAARISLTAYNKTKNRKWLEPLTLFLGAPILGFVKNAAVTALSLVDTVSKEAKLNIDPILPTAGINLYAEGGFLSGTMGYCSVYGTVGASFRSVNAGVLGLVNASLDSLVATGMYGFRSAGLSGLKGVTIESGFKTIIATPNGTLDIKGKKIDFNSTMNVLVKGGGGVNLAAPTMTTSAGKILGLRGKQVQTSAEAIQTIAVAKKYGIEITPAGVKVGNLAGTTIDPSKPMLEITPAGVTVLGGPAGPVELKVTPAGVSLKAAGNDLRHMGATLLSKSTRVELC